jgi:hypothetical protein
MEVHSVTGQTRRTLPAGSQPAQVSLPRHSFERWVLADLAGAPKQTLDPPAKDQIGNGLETEGFSISIWKLNPRSCPTFQDAGCAR